MRETTVGDDGRRESSTRVTSGSSQMRFIRRWGGFLAYSGGRGAGHDRTQGREGSSAFLYRVCASVAIQEPNLICSVYHAIPQEGTLYLGDEGGYNGTEKTCSQQSYSTQTPIGVTDNSPFNIPQRVSRKISFSRPAERTCGLAGIDQYYPTGSYSPFGQRRADGVS